MWRTLVILMLLAAAFPAADLHAQTSTRPNGVPMVRGRRVQLDTNAWHEARYTKQELEGARLYFSTDMGKTWALSDSKLSEPRVAGGRPFFLFTAAADGEYAFKFLLKTEAAPVAGDRPSRSVYFDATPPALAVQAPTASSYYNRGDSINIAYTATDENLDGATGFKLEYTLDGNAFIVITEKAQVTGNYVWSGANFTEPMSIQIRVAVTDKVGNVSQQLIQDVNVGQRPTELRGGGLSLTMSAPEVIYFENTDFFFEVNNPGNNPIAFVAVWYTMDGGATWKTGGANYSGDLTGTVVCHFPPGVRRGTKRFGNYEQIGFIYQLATTDGLRTAGDPLPGAEPMANIPVDLEAPLLHITMPSVGDKLYRGEIPNNPESGKYFINWGGADRNPLPYVETPGQERGPVSIWYTTNPDAPEADKKWVLLTDRQPISRGKFIKTNDLPIGRVQIKIVAEDQMGNTSERVTGVVEVIDGSGWEAPVRGRGAMEIDRIWSEATQLYHSGEFAAAVKKFDSALEIAPSDRLDSVRHDRAVALNADGRVNDAIADLTRCVMNSPKNLTFRYSLAAILYRNDRRLEAREQLDKIVELDGKEPHIKARSMLASIEHQAGNGDRAIALWTYIVKHGSASSEEVKNAQAQLKREKGE